MIEIFSSLTILILTILVYFQRKTIFSLEEEVWFLEQRFREETGKQPPVFCKNRITNT
jgi:hypothetical protein